MRRLLLGLLAATALTTAAPAQIADQVVPNVNVANITGAAWTTFTPTIVCGVSGAVAGYTLQLGRYQVVGKTVFMNMELQASGAGTCSGSLNANFSASGITSGAGKYNVPGYDFTGTAGALSCQLNNGAQQCVASTSINGNITTTDHIIITGVFESN